MNDVLVVRPRQSMRDLNAIIDRLANRYGAVPQQFPECAALQQLRHQIRRTVENAELVGGEDIGMVKSRSRLRFLLEAMEPVGISRNKDGRTLIATSRFKVAGAVHLAHPSCTQQAENFIDIKFRAYG